MLLILLKYNILWDYFVEKKNTKERIVFFCFVGV